MSDNLTQLSLNERRLIDLVAAHGTIARVDLAQHSGMTGASVTRLIARLLEIGIFNEVPDRRGASGQPKRLLSLNAGAFFAGGLTFSLKRMEIAILDLSGGIVANETVGIEQQSARHVADLARRKLDGFCIEHGIARERMVGVGCAVPGNFGTFSTVLKAHELFAEFSNERTSNAFADVFDIPFFFENDGSAAALGEHVFGRQEADGASLFFIHIGHGVGGGAVVDGRLFRGVHGNACLPGVLFPYGAPRPSGQDLFDNLARAGIMLEDFDELEMLSPTGQEVLDQWIARAGCQLRQALRVATGFFDPSVVVLGGRLPASLNDRLIEVMLAEPIEGPSRGLSVAPLRASKLGPKAGAIGGACIPLFSTFYSGSTWDAGNAYLNGRRAQSSAAVDKAT